MSTAKRGPWVGIALAVACLMGVVLAAFGASGALAEKGPHPQKKPADRVRALVLGEAQSPLLEDLKRDQGWQLTQAANARGRGNDPAKYDALVVDGDTLSPEQLGGGTLVDEFADADRWVLALDTSPADYDRGLIDHTGFTPGERGGKSRMFLFSSPTLGNSPRVVMIEAKSLRPRGSGSPGIQEREEFRRATALQTEEVASTATRAVSANRATLAREYAPPGTSGLPPQLLHVGWTYSDVGSSDNPRGYWTREDCTGSIFGICPPRHGYQTPSWTLNHDFDVYLDNGDGHPQGNFQYVTYALDGEFTPKKADQRFFHMFDPFLVGLTKDQYFLERCCWTGKAGVSIKPFEAVTRENLIYQAATPATPNEESEYKTGEEFEVGFSLSKGGPEFTDSHKVSYEETHPIADWGVQNKTSGNEFSWLFSARRPCDLRPEHFNRSACFNEGRDKNGTPLLPNDLSRGQLQLHAEGRWRTKKLLTGQEGQNNEFLLQTPIDLIDTYCIGVAIFQCDPKGTVSQKEGYWTSATAPSFDIGAVNPIPIKSLTFAPNPANGTRHDRVTGTVTLARPALMDTNVTIYSNSENATVGVSDGSGVSTVSITIDKGKASGTFQVLTNDNKLSPGQHTTATITAFYARSFQEQLVVEAHKKGA